MSASFSPRVGERFADRFELTAPLRGDGAVKAFLAFDHHAGREAELVLFDPECAHPKAWSAFARLVAAASEAKIAGLVLPRSVGSSPPVPPYCLAEPQAARGLDRLRDQGPVPWRRALTIGERTAEILEKAAAATGAAHRSLTPSRCLVSARDEVKVLDFGVAELEQGGSADSSYRPPGDGAEARSDVYALAVILFELISGQRCSTTPPPRLRSLVAAPQSVDDLLAKATAPEASQRPGDITALRAELRALLGLSPIDNVPKNMSAPPLLAGQAASASREANAAPAAPAAARPEPPRLPQREARVEPPRVASVEPREPEASVEPRDLDERTAPLPAARAAPAPLPERSVEPPVVAVPADELLPLPEREPEIATVRVPERSRPDPARRTGAQPPVADRTMIVDARRTGPQAPVSDQTVIGDPRRTGAQAPVSEHTVIGDPRRTGAQAPVGSRTGAQSAIRSRTGAQSTVSVASRGAPARRTGAQAPVPRSASRVAPGRGTSALAMVSEPVMATPGRATGPNATVVATPGRATGPNATVMDPTPGRATGPLATVADRTVIAPAPVAGPAREDRTMILDLRRTGAQPSAGDRTMVLDPNAAFAGDRTMVLSQDRIDGAPSRADTTLLLPYPEDPSRAAANDDEDGEGVEAPPAARASAPAGWTLRRILIVANVVFVVLLIAGLLVTVAT